MTRGEYKRSVKQYYTVLRTFLGTPQGNDDDSGTITRRYDGMERIRYDYYGYDTLTFLKPEVPSKQLPPLVVDVVYVDGDRHHYMIRRDERRRLAKLYLGDTSIGSIELKPHPVVHLLACPPKRKGLMRLGYNTFVNLLASNFPELKVMVV